MLVKAGLTEMMRLLLSVTITPSRMVSRITKARRKAESRASPSPRSVTSMRAVAVARSTLASMRTTPPSAGVLEQRCFQHLPHATVENGVEETPERTLRLGRDKLLERPRQHLLLVALQQAASGHVDARDHAFAAQREIADGRLLIQLGIKVAADFKCIVQLLQFVQCHILHFQLDLVYLQLMQLAHHLFI